MKPAPLGLSDQLLARQKEIQLKLKMYEDQVAAINLIKGQL